MSKTAPLPACSFSAAGSDSPVSAVSRWRGLIAPLNLAAYAILTLVAFNQLGTGAAARQGGYAVAGCAVSLGVFALAFVLREGLEYTPGRAWAIRVLLLVQAIAAMTNLALIYDGMNPILLVLIAAQLPAFVSMSSAIVVLILLNAMAFLFLREFHALARPLFNISVYGTFQAFAMLTAHFAFRAERANRELQAVNAHLLATRSLLEEGARDGERLRLSRELHDVAGHALTALKLNLELAQRLPESTDRQDRIAEAQKLADTLLDNIRAVVNQLRDHDGVDLPAALDALCRGFPGVEVRLNTSPSLRVNDIEQAETILRSIQEALTNAVRHGRARRIAIDLHCPGKDLVVRIADDGIGARDPRPGNGLTGIRERIARFDGDVHFETTPGAGFVLTLLLPGRPRILS